MSEKISVDQCSFMPAFKEWQVICDALADGRQSLILRKGGIAEGKAGFSWQHRDFFLFPTRFHQQLEGTRAPGQAVLPPPANDNTITIRHLARIVSSCLLQDWQTVEKLEPYHCWTSQVIRDRFEWGDKPAISAALVRVYELPVPWVLQNADRPTFGGCRSWLNLPTSEWDPTIAGSSIEKAMVTATPVLDDREFESLHQKIPVVFGN